MPDTHITVQPETLLVQAPAETTLITLNDTLAEHRLWLPVVPLHPARTLAQAVAANAGGRYHLAHGSIAHYLRAATLQSTSQPTTRLAVGGPTLKRATGYGLARALVGTGPPYRHLPGVGRLHAVTLHVRPLPPARRALLLHGATAVVCRLALDMLEAGLLPAALAARSLPAADATALLVVLEGVPDALDRHTRRLSTLVLQAGVDRLEWLEQPAELARAWQPWEHLAATWHPDDSPLTLPRAKLAGALETAKTLARRYRLRLEWWGDLGTGRLHLRLQTDDDAPTATRQGEREQAQVLLRHQLRHIPPAPVPPAPLGPSGGALLDDLRAIVGTEYVRTRRGDLLCYMRDGSIAAATGWPCAVVLPGNTAEVSQVMQCAATAGVPVVTRGAGSGLAGGSTSTPDALVLVLTRLHQLAIDPVQQVAHVGAGVVTAEVQQAAAAHGLLYAPDPSSQGVSTIGGNIACNAGGPRCVKYGVTANYVTALTAVLADGSIVQLADDDPDTAGLLHLLIGSEGTLALVTAATLRLLPQPPARRTTLALFQQIEAACATVEAIMASGVLPASLELLDNTAMRVVEEALHLGLPADAGALLLLLADGEPQQVEWETQRLADLARNGGAYRVEVAQSADDEAAFWRARRSIGPALARVLPNKISEDICVPVPQVATTVRRIRAIAERYGLTIPVFGHAGDGNLHPNVLFDARDPELSQRAWQAAEEIFTVALDVGGTLSGEHGIGVLKQPFLPQALGSEVLALHQRIKAHFDPAGRLNPGKVLAVPPCGQGCLSGL